MHIITLPTTLKKALLLQTLYLKKKEITIIGENMEKNKPSYTPCGNVNWYSHYGNQYGVYSKNEE